MMMKSSSRNAPGGKGNAGMFIERDPKICAAGLPSAQHKKTVAGCLNSYLLQHEVDALIGDSIKPEPELCKLPPLKLKPRDHRHVGQYTEAANLINPPSVTKFQSLVEDFKSTVFSSYWKAKVGAGPDPTPIMPEGFDYLKTTLGKKTSRLSLYDVIMPKNPVPNKTPAFKSPGYQTDRNYCRPSFSPDCIFGMRSDVDPQGKWMKWCLRDDRIPMGITNQPIDFKQADFTEINHSQLGKSKALYDNISCVPPGHTFGKVEPPSEHVPNCLTTCELNEDRAFIKMCIGHLNTLRMFLKKRFHGTFFASLYLELKHFDKNKSGWLPKDFVYHLCSSKFVRFKPKLIEPLLVLWNAFNGSEIRFMVFVDVINHTKVIPELPLVRDIPEDCVEARTIYSEMTDPNQVPGKHLRAGLPSGRYMDKDYPVTPQGCCKADRTNLPQETDSKSCVFLNVFTHFGISHRDMYAKRTPAIIRRVFEAAGENFEDEEFETAWNIAKQDHSEGSVCYETFRRALDKSKTAKN